MGTHPIFESDFDCLTDGIGLNDVTYRNATTTGSRGLGLQ